MELIRTKFKKTEVGLIPEDWQVKKLGDVGSCIIGLTYSPMDVGNSGTLVLRSSNVQDNKLAFHDNVYVTKTIPDNLRVKKGDILVCVRNGSRNLIGKCAILDKRVEGETFGAFMSVFRTENSKYVFQTFHSNSIKRQIDENLGATINQITNKALNSFLVPFPPTLTEQTAIANALSDVDEMIAKLEKLIEKKKAIKQGAMQQLLTPPHKGGKRLQGFSGEWVETTLGQLCDIRKGQLITEKTRIHGDIPVIAGGKSPAYFHNKANRLGKTITISGSGASAGYVSFHANPIFASDCSTIEESQNYSLRFLFFFLQLFQDKIYKLQTGGAQPHIHPSDLNPIAFHAPKKDEQEAIAKILLEMESEIISLEEKKEKSSWIKQGMMQELLTGKTRLV